MQREEAGNKTKKVDKKRIALIAGLSVIVVVLIILASLSVKVSAYDKIFPNVTAGGIDIGAETKEDAEKKLEEALEEIYESEFTLSLEDKSKVFKLSDIGASADIEKTVQNAYDYGKKGSILRRIGKYINSKNVSYNAEIVSEIDNDRIEEMISKLAEGCEVPVKETEFSVLGDTLTIINGHDGIHVDREKAKRLIKNTIFNSKDKKIELKLEDAKPKKVDLDELYKKITEGKKNAAYKRENGEIVVVEGFPEIELNKNDLKAALESGKETYDIKVKVTPPEITGENLRAMLFRDKMGSWTSNFSGANVPRSSNVRLSASRINGITLMPGETFSYDKTIGSRTAANGYKTATVYVGNTLDEGIGGGICQTSSTLYSAVLYANLEIVSRTSHSLPVSYMPAGQDATIAEGYIDFKFKNNTDYPIKIVCTTSYGSVTCSIMGVKPEGQSVSVVNTKTSTIEPKTTRTLKEEIPVGYKKVTQKGAVGYTVSSQRIVSVNGVEKKRENLTKSVYKALDNIIEVNPSDKNTSTEELKDYSEYKVETEGTTKPTDAPQSPIEGQEQKTEEKIEENLGDNSENVVEEAADNVENQPKE